MRELAESGSAAVAVLERRVRLLEARQEALTEAVEVLAQGLDSGPLAGPENSRPEKAARRARELLLLAKPEQRGE